MAMEPMTLPAPPTEWLDLLTLTQARIAERDPSLTYLGTTSEAGRALADMAGQTRSTVWNAQRIMSFYAMRDGRALTEAARRRGVAFRFMSRPVTLSISPIMSSYEPEARVGPVPGPLMIMDARHVVLPGRDGESIWTSSDAGLVALAIRAYEAVWSTASRAVPEGEEPPLTPRMVDISWLLADGATDRMISRELGISERTVSNEVREIGRRLGAANRAHTIARICGNPL